MLLMSIYALLTLRDVYLMLANTFESTEASLGWVFKLDAAASFIWKFVQLTRVMDGGVHPAAKSM